MILHAYGRHAIAVTAVKENQNYRCYSTVEEPAKQHIVFVPTYFAPKDEAFKNIV